YFARKLNELTGQPVVVENKPGASAMIGAATAARAAPDGYTVLITTNTTHAANEHLYKTLTYHPVKDYAPISLLGKGGQIMVVNPGSPAKTVG
ncbi:tripartite tricarboxylate transporter substrate binding protein, partial [Xylella fastidiosa subsp. multiplex]|nr:tripartite tricarboxylate transporter substrate binding protein [Xylella fastidiosa subsp. multiplex]